jgi:hypothetical protein
MNNWNLMKPSLACKWIFPLNVILHTNLQVLVGGSNIQKCITHLIFREKATVVCSEDLLWLSTGVVGIWLIQLILADNWNWVLPSHNMGWASLSNYVQFLIYYNIQYFILFNFNSLHHSSYIFMFKSLVSMEVWHNGHATVFRVKEW